MLLQYSAATMFSFICQIKQSPVSYCPIPETSISAASALTSPTVSFSPPYDASRSLMYVIMFSKPQQMSRVKVCWLQDVHVSNFGYFYCWGRVLWPCTIARATALHALITPCNHYVHWFVARLINSESREDRVVSASASQILLCIFCLCCRVHSSFGNTHSQHKTRYTSILFLVNPGFPKIEIKGWPRTNVIIIRKPSCLALITTLRRWKNRYTSLKLIIHQIY